MNDPWVEGIAAALTLKARYNEAKTRIAELEKALRPLVVQWEECEKLRVEQGEAEAMFTSIPVENKKMRRIREVLDHD